MTAPVNITGGVIGPLPVFIFRWSPDELVGAEWERLPETHADVMF